ncbi:geraniol 8-hydroxylase-like protein [Tanacetum coccineum]
MISHIQWSWDYVLLFTCSIITFAILWCEFSSKARLPPGPRGLPLLGYLPFLDPNLHHGYTKLAQRYGPIFKLKLGSKTHIVVGSSDLAKVVLREQDEIFANRDPPIAGTILTYGGQDIVWSDNNSLWRNMRKVFAYEVLSNKNLDASSTFRRGGVRKTIKHVYETMGTEVDIGGIAFLTSLDVVTNMVWGKSLVEDVKSTNLGVEFREVITKIVELLGAVNVSDFFSVLSRFDLQGVGQEMKRQSKILDAIFERIIKERIAIKRDEAVEKIGRKDFLQILLELKEQNASTSLNITQIKALLTDIFVGTTDTTSTMSEWTMAELLKNSSMMQKSSGRRRCPGVPLGEKMLVYFLASMLHSFNWTLPNGEHELSDKFGIVLKKNTPLMAIASQRLPDKTLYM